MATWHTVGAPAIVQWRYGRKHLTIHTTIRSVGRKYVQVNATNSSVRAMQFAMDRPGDHGQLPCVSADAWLWPLLVLEAQQAADAQRADAERVLRQVGLVTMHGDHGMTTDRLIVLAQFITDQGWVAPDGR